MSELNIESVVAKIEKLANNILIKVRNKKISEEDYAELDEILLKLEKENVLLKKIDRRLLGALLNYYILYSKEIDIRELSRDIIYMKCADLEGMLRYIFGEKSDSLINENPMEVSVILQEIDAIILNLLLPARTEKRIDETSFLAYEKILKNIYDYYDKSKEIHKDISRILFLIFDSLLTEAQYCREENILTMKVDELERYMKIIFDYPKQLKEE